MKKKRVYLMRHGKAAASVFGGEDHLRPLTPEGEQNCRLMGRWLAARDESPRLIISSHAVRAYETARIMAAQLGLNPTDIRIDKDIYFRGADRLLDILAGLPEEEMDVLLVGHNPDMSQLVSHFSGMDVFMKTSALYAVEFDTDNWTEIPLARRQSLYLQFARDLK